MKTYGGEKNYGFCLYCNKARFAGLMSVCFVTDAGVWKGVCADGVGEADRTKGKQHRPEVQEKQSQKKKTMWFSLLFKHLQKRDNNCCQDAR